MKKKFNVENLDCAHCAAKMEEMVAKIDGVTDVSVNFLTQKITISADESAFKALLPEVEKACKRVDKEFIIHY